VSQRQFYRTRQRFKIKRAPRIALGFHLRFPFIAPFEDKTLGRIDLDDLAGIGQAAIGEIQSPG